MVMVDFRVATEKERKDGHSVTMALDVYQGETLLTTIFPDVYRIDENIAKKIYFNSVKEDMYLAYAPVFNC